MNTGILLADEIKKNPHDTTLVKVFADYCEEQSWVTTGRWIRENGISDGGPGYGGDGYGGGGGGDGDGDGGGGGDGYGGGGGGGGDGADGYGYGGGGDGTKHVPEVYLMTDGLYIVCVKGGYYPYVFIGWVERHDFLLRVINSRIIRRFGSNAQLSLLAKNGPKLDANPTELLDLSPEEWVPLSAVCRAIPATESAWKKLCPKPEEMLATVRG